MAESKENYFTSKMYSIRRCFIKQYLMYLVTLILSILQSSNDLSIDKVCADAVLAAVMPGGEDFFAEVKTPWCMLLLSSLPPHLLLTL